MTNRLTELIILMILIGSMSIFSSPGNTETPIVKVGQPAPSIEGKTPDNRDFSLNSIKGKIIIINFWASWCPPCRKELPYFAELYNELKIKGVEIVAVNIDTTLSKAEKFLSSLDIPFTVVLDPKQEIVTQYRPPAMPTSYIIDREGIVRYIHEGYSKKDQSLFKSEIENLLGTDK